MLPAKELRRKRTGAAALEAALQASNSRFRATVLDDPFCDPGCRYFGRGGSRRRWLDLPQSGRCEPSRPGAK